MENTATKTYQINDNYFFVTVGVEFAKGLSNKARSILVIHSISEDATNPIKQVHEVEFNNEFVSKHTQQAKQYAIFDKSMFYYKITNDLVAKKVKYQQYRFSFVSLEEELM